MDKSMLIMSIIVINILAVGGLALFKANKLKTTQQQLPMSGNQKLIVGVMAFVGLLIFVTFISLYFLRTGGS